MHTTNEIHVGADSIIHFLSQMGIKVLHNFPGGTIAPLLDACHKFNIRVITSRHEQGAGYAALAQAKLTGLPGIVAVTSGPGVTNVMTSVADAYFDGIPMLVFTGQVGTADLARHKDIRQRGFQEVDTPLLMQPITKAQYQPHNVSELLEMIPEAWQKAMEGRKGPVSIDLPMDVQRAQFTRSLFCLNASEIRVDGDALAVFINPLISAITQAKRPVIIAGNGMMNPKNIDGFKQLLKIWPVPVSSSLLAVGLVDSDSKLCLGFHGHTGSQVAGLAIHEADLVLVLGSRLDVRQTGTQTQNFAPHAKKFRVDFDRAEIAYSRVDVDSTYYGALQHFLPELLAKLQNLQQTLPDLSPWYQKIAEYKSQFGWCYPEYPGLAPQSVIEQISKAISSPVICVTGVGSHQHWVARHFRFHYPQRQLLTSAGHGAMGYDLPTAIGAAIHAPETQVLCIVGDGSLQMNIQELGMIQEYQLKIKIVVLDNHRLGLVSQFQLMNWETDTACGLKKSPDFFAIAQAYGIRAFHATKQSEFEAVLDDFVKADSAALLHLELDSRHDVLPMLLGPQSMDKMWPFYDMQGELREQSK